VRHLHFTQSLEPLQGGGLGTSAATLHRHLLAMGFPSRLCATYGQAPVASGEQILEFARIKPDCLYYAPELKKQAAYLVAQADVIHGHGFYTGPNFILGCEARHQNKPLVYHAHGFFEPWILARSRWKKQLVHWLFEDANFRHVRLWRALTETEANQIRACGIRAPIVVAPNGLDLEEFPKPLPAAGSVPMPLLPNLEKRNCRLLFLGRIHPKKGLDLLLTAWARVSQVRNQWELVIAGPDENGYLAEVQRLAKSLALEGQVRFTGPATGAAKHALLHSADVFILPSYSEGFSMGLLEALACEVPVVATRACNFPDISLRQAGWECDAALPSVTRTLEAALSADTLERRQRGRNGRALVERSYTWPMIIPRLLEACKVHC
jgi:glycosyltransferase involved in cell wall biosynthesis